jgi:hypothetical protein
VREVSVGTDTFRVGRLNVFDQFDVTRKIGPLAPALVPVFRKLGELEQLQGDKVESVVEAALPFLEALAKIPNDDSRFVIGTCLSVVQRQRGSSWAPMYRDGVAMFDDLDLSTVGPLVLEVVKDNLGPFISGVLTAQMSAKGSPAGA